MTDAAPLRLCLHWPRLGPYHLARIEGARRTAPGGAEVVALETASDDATYAWRPETDAVPWRREVALPGRVYEAVPAREMAAAVRAALDRLDPDAVAITSYATPDARAALAWCRRRRRVAVLMSDTRADDAPRVGWRERVKRALVEQYDAALVAGTAHRAYTASLGMPPELIFTPYDVVDNAFFEAPVPGVAADTLPGLDDPAPFFLASGRFVVRKNLDGLLRAYAAYRTGAAAPWRLLVLGDGPLRDDLGALAGDGVVFCGFQQRDALPTYYARAGAFVHPAHMDQWGLVVNEAMAAGLPVLVSAGAGCAPDLVRDGANGWTFDPDDAGALATLLARTAHEADREAMGARSRAIIAAYTPNAFGRAAWDAAAAGRARADRGLSSSARLALAALGAAARRVQSFHAIPE